MTTTHKIVTVAPKPATEAGALAGFEAVCSCGFRMGTSLSLRVAAEEGAKHVRFMAEKAARKPSRR